MNHFQEKLLKVVRVVENRDWIGERKKTPRLHGDVPEAVADEVEYEHTREGQFFCKWEIIYKYPMTWHILKISYDGGNFLVYF
ncbi:MAG: hypothetical protein ACTSUE_20450 [Promethearchaeota archaeon]